MANPPPGQNKPNNGQVGLYCSPNVPTSSVTFGLSAQATGSTAATPICADIVFSGQVALYTPLTTIYAVIGKFYSTSTVIANIGAAWSKFVFQGTQLSCSISTMAPPAWGVSPSNHANVLAQQYLLIENANKYQQNKHKIFVSITNGTKSTYDFGGEEIEAGGSSIVEFLNDRKLVNADLQHKQAYIVLQHLIKGPYTLVDEQFKVVGQLTK